MSRPHGERGFVSVASLMIALAAILVLCGTLAWPVLSLTDGERAELIAAVEALPDAAGGDHASWRELAGAFGYDLRDDLAQANSGAASPEIARAFAQRVRAYAQTGRLWEVRELAALVAAQPEVFTEASVTKAQRLERGLTPLPGLALIVLALTLLVQMRPLPSVLAVLVFTAGAHLAWLVASLGPESLPGNAWGLGAWSAWVTAFVWMQGSLATLAGRLWLRRARRTLWVHQAFVGRQGS